MEKCTSVSQISDEERSFGGATTKSANGEDTRGTAQLAGPKRNVILLLEVERQNI